jgi:hypothetical protein
LNGGGSAATVTLNLDNDITLTSVTADLNGPVHITVKNTSGGTLAKGTPVYATGSVGASGAVEVSPSDADVASTMPALGLLDDALANNAEGSATVLGIIGGINTSSYAVNDELYVSTTAGVLTATRPTGASELVQKIGRVVRVDASTGEILVLGSGRANDVPNGTLSNDTTGNAATATALETARTINGVSFDGTANITVAAAAGTLTGATLASGVTASSLTSVGTLSALSVGGNITVTGTVDGRDVAADGTKLDGIESGADVTDAANVETAIEAITLTSVAGATGDEILVVDATDGGLKAVLWQNLPAAPVDSVNSQTGIVVLDADDISDAATTNKFTTAANLTKLGHITVTQAVDLDTIESRVNQLDAAVVLQGSWDASAGSFPGSGSAQAGESYIVSVAGTVDSVAFSVNDRLLAIVDNASTSTYASNWLKLDYTDQVLSVNTQTGAVVLDADDISDTSTTNKFTTAADITKLAGIESGATADQTAADIRGLGFFDTTNDGTGSGLDADLLDGNHATAFATAAQGSTADSALQNVVEDTTPQLGGALDVNGQEITGAIDLHSTGDVITELGDAAGVNKLSVRDSAAVEVAAFDSDGNLTLAGTVDGRDVAADGTKLDGIAAGAEVNAVDSVNSQTGVVVLDADDISDAATTNKFTTAADITKLAGIETGADVTDAANVETSIEAITLTAVAGATGDEVLIVDATDGGLKAVLWENLPSGGGGGISNVVEDTTPQLGGALDVNGQEITGAIDLHSTGDVIIELGDAAGTNKVSVRDSGAVEQFLIDSDGNVGVGKTPNAGSRLDVNGRIEAYQNTLQTNNDDYAFITSGNFGGGYGFYEGTNRAVIVAPGGNQMEFHVGGSPTSWGTMAIDIDASGNVRFPVSIQDSTGRDISDAVTSTDVTDIVEISQASYTALGAGRPANRLYLITS